MVNVITIGAGGDWIDSRAGQIGHSVAIAATFLRSCVAQARYMLLRNTSSMVKILFLI